VRWVALGAICLLALLYYRPVRAYIGTKQELAARKAEVRTLAARKALLEKRLQLTDSGATLVRSARRLGLVKPGEHLFIVKGIADWRREHGRKPSK
jgi:cell division protein FtsB